ncbi:MAG: 50S ribosomal protein L24, partial [Bacteroidota bacterium]
MGALPIRKNDQVQVIAGRDKGKSGRVLEVIPEKKQVFVEHVNMIKRHTKPNPSKQIRGGILEKEGPIHVSNVALVCSEC